MGRSIENQGKSKPSSIRFSEEVKEIIGGMDGKTFTDKFENLVYEYKRTIPERNKKLKELNKEIEDKQKYLNKLKSEIQAFESVKNAFKDFICHIESANKIIKKL